MLCLLALTAASAASRPAVVQVDNATATVRFQTLASGRVQPVASNREYLRQWPGSYFETSFRGKAVMFKLGRGDVIIHVLVDGRNVTTLIKPASGVYRIEGLHPGRHVARLEIASESQSGPTAFKGFFGGHAATPLLLAARRRQIEFIGDSHTVGYASTSTKQVCTDDEVWRSTDTSRAFGPLLAKRYDADYEVNAISGRGVVRNYNGFAADPLPVAYSHTLFSSPGRVEQSNWRPRLIVISLGTNDFTTPLHEGEKWVTRQALREDFVRTYVKFVSDLRKRNPKAFFIIFATEKADGEIQREVAKVVSQLRALGETRLRYLPINGLSFSACNSHPSILDNERIAQDLGKAVAAVSDVWDG